ncbi:MAG: hypothetical protein ACK5P5_09215 [Pseudobdellovibrionaceae bacterium]
MNKLIRLRNKFDSIIKNQKILVYGFVFLSFILVLNSFWPKEKSIETKAKEQIQVDTLIPLGYVLVPIQIHNFESASALLGEAGIVDLWSVDPNTEKKSRKIASRLKIIRAPLNPQMYAVLVPESASSRILEYGDTFLVTVQSHRSQSPEVISPKKNKFTAQIETFEMKE